MSSETTGIKVTTCKYYRTRDGKLAYVAGILPKVMAANGCGTGEMYVGYIEQQQEPMTWHADGMYYSQEDGFDTDPWDLVVELPTNGLI